MQISKKGLDLLKTWEQGPDGGFASIPYYCSSNKLTIGYGHVINLNESIKYPISEAKAEELLKKDIAWAEKVVNTCVKVPLTQNQFNALVCFVFNIGVLRFKQSTLLSILNQGLYTEVPQQLLRWNVATIGGVKKTLEGLTNRRKAEIALWGDAEN
jgi:GH24 family phage-related lysozyme (muramidase)